ncbi:MAG TPA: ACT domain-containing protein [Tissierellia bacterium]|jgi:ACT domain-containing protein|nr:ACT domain-containing protein [Tissierellia bacterium]
MKAIITIFGKDKVGIIASVATLLAKHNVNILDITQTVMREYFTMTMLVDLSGSKTEFIVLQDELSKKGQELKMDIRIQREDIFEKMYEI